MTIAFFKLKNISLKVKVNKCFKTVFTIFRTNLCLGM